MLTLQRRWAPYLALLLAGAFFNLVIPPATWAQIANVDDTLRQAEVSYLEGDYEGAVGMLEPLLTTSSLTKNQTAKTHELLAYCYDALDKEEKIRENVRILFEMNRKYPMKDEWMADRMRRIVDEVKTQLAEEDQKPAAEVAQKEPATPPDHMTPAETSGGGGGKKYLIYGGAAVVGIGLIALLAGGGGGGEEAPPPDSTLPTAPGTPTRR